MSTHQIPNMTEADLGYGFSKAYQSPRRRYAHILHDPGAEFNAAFNFMLKDSYMRPHLHAGDQKFEDIYLLKGRLALSFFDDLGNVTEHFLLDQDALAYVRVPPYTWHTYVILTDEVVTYETMLGKYDPVTWKQLAPWAAAEGDPDSKLYLDFLRELT